MASELSAVIFDIQRFCLHDGPGIRTTVFFKGCPLRCKWCHNPESLTQIQQLSYRAHKCVFCGACAGVCVAGVHCFEHGAHSVGFAKCGQCGNCVQVCCYGALELLGSRKTLTELIASVMIDKPYFEGGGGVTLSGGEPMMQPIFAVAFTQKLHKQGVHVAMETCGYAPESVFEEIEPYIDLFLFDYKATGEKKHAELTGVDNRRILSNLEMLNKAGKQIILRCPIIPELNDTEEHFRRIADISKQFAAITGVEILPYHNMGETKRLQIGTKASLLKISPATDSDKRSWLETLHKFGCTASLV